MNATENTIHVFPGFMIHERIDKNIWGEMKKAGAHYMSADDLEDQDMFDSEPGWRYSLNALAVLLRHGFTLDIREQLITNEADLRAMFTPEAIAAYSERKAQERAAAERAEAERKAAHEREKEAKRAVYAAWKAEHLAGLVKSSTMPDRAEHEWTLVGNFDADAGGWYTTGDQWYTTTVNGATVYRDDYGNAVLYYAPPALVDEWAEAWWQQRNAQFGAARAARHLLNTHKYDGGVYGGDVVERLIDKHGLDYFVALARAEEWLIDMDNRSDHVETAEKYGLPYALMSSLPQHISYAEMQRHRRSPKDEDGVRDILRHPDGRTFVRTYNDNWYEIQL